MGEKTRKTVKCYFSRCFLFRRGHESAVRLQPPGGQLVPGDPAQPREGQLRHRALQQPALHHWGAGREERGHRHGAVLGPRGPETDGGMRPAPGSVPPRQRHHQEVVHPHPEDRARSRVGLTAGARRVQSRGEPASLSPALRSCFGHGGAGPGAHRGSPWGLLGSHSFGTLETSQEWLWDLPQEERRVILNMQDTPVPCQVLYQALLYTNAFHCPNDLITGYYNSHLTDEETELERG